MVKSKPIPARTKRLLRRESGYGCNKCGNPIYQYHHIVPQSNDKKDLMLLCPNCHNEATFGAMTVEEQREYKSNPCNVEKGYSNGLLKINQSVPAVNIGNIQFINQGEVFSVDNEPVISMNINRMNRLELSLDLFDENDIPVLQIDHNEWISGDPHPWDIETSYQWIKIRRKERDIALFVNAKKYPIEISANLFKKGQHLKLDKRWVKFNGVIQNFTMMNLCWVAIYLNADTVEKKLQIVPNKRLGKGQYISWPDEKTRIEKGIELWIELNRRAQG